MEYLTDIANGRLANDSAMHAKFVAYGFIDRRMDKITELGKLALEQNSIKASKVEKPKDLAFVQCIDFWLKNFHPGWTFGGAQGKALKSLINKIRTISTDPTDSTVLATFQKLCQSLPEWYKNKDLPVIDSKFNEIVTEIQEGPAKGWNQMNSAERLFYGQ